MGFRFPEQLRCSASSSALTAWGAEDTCFGSSGIVGMAPCRWHQPRKLLSAASFTLTDVALRFEPVHEPVHSLRPLLGAAFPRGPGLLRAVALKHDATQYALRFARKV